MEMEKLSYTEALTQLAQQSGVPIRYEDGVKPEFVKQDNKIEQFIELYERTASMFHYLLMETDSGKKALEYIKKRGLTDETLKKF